MANNTVTFYHQSQNIYSMRSQPLVVEVDGLPAPWLEVLEITLSKGPQLNEARFRLAGLEQGQAVRFEDIALAVRSGQRIRVSMICQIDPASGNQMSWPFFAGVICEGHASIAGRAEEVEVIARDEPAYYGTAIIDGIRAIGLEDKPVYINSAQAVFNPDGLPNCSSAVMEVDGKTQYVFQLEPTKAKYWTYAEAVNYIASEYLGVETQNSLSFAALAGLTCDQVLRDVDVTGLTALEAVDRLCRRAGLGFCLVHAPDKDSQVEQVLQFYRRGSGRRIYLRHQLSGNKLDLGQTNLAQCSVNIIKPAESIRTVGRGDVKRFEMTAQFVKGWDPSLEVNNYDLYSPATNENFLEVKDVFRKWVLNEAGDYSGAPFNQGPTYDLSSVFGTSDYNPHRRRFWPCLSTSVAGKSQGYYLEVSYDGGVTWVVYPGAFDILLNECGIYLSSTQLDSAIWYAIKKDKLCFRITATLISDERLEAVVCDGPINSSRRIRTEVFNLGKEFKYQQVTPASIFFDVKSSELGPPDVRDDRENIRSLLRDQIHRLRQGHLAGSAELPFIRGDIWPGDILAGVTGREVDFQKIGGANEYAPQVEKVKITFDKQWSTTIIFGEG
ncbi:hypothetical protein ACFL02_07460 [Planctomycetota bacterium]